MKSSCLLFAGLCMTLSGPALAGTLKVSAFDSKGRALDREGLLRFIAPIARSEGQTPAQSGLFISDLDGVPLEGRPWWDENSKETIWRWSGAGKARISLPWPIRKDGFSTITLDARGEGYAGEQNILLNEEIAINTYYQLQEAFKRRSTVWKPTYKPSTRAKELIANAKEKLRAATVEEVLRKRAKRFDEALAETSFAWQQILFEHGRQTLSDSKRADRMRWGVTLDERVIDRIQEYDWIAERLNKAGINWVRLVFRVNEEDFLFERKGSFTLYDQLTSTLRRHRVHVMGSILDSMLWPPDVTPEAFETRTRNLALHYRDTIRSWEVASEPNGTWIGGTKTPLPEETILEAVQRGARAVKKIDPALETTASLHWWEGTAPNGRGLFQWLRWSIPRGFGDNIDVVGLSVYPARHPLGIAFDPVFMQLHRLFPTQNLMLAGWSYEE
ncbi:MAG: hypothetical protein COB53_11430, partial [Elusimicrobia bacterium]